MAITETIMVSFDNDGHAFQVAERTGDETKCYDVEKVQPDDDTCDEYLASFSGSPYIEGDRHYWLKPGCEHLFKQHEPQNRLPTIHDRWLRPLSDWAQEVGYTIWCERCNCWFGDETIERDCPHFEWSSEEGEFVEIER